MPQKNQLNPNLTYPSANSVAGGWYTARKLVGLALPALAGKRFLALGCNMGFARENIPRCIVQAFPSVDSRRSGQHTLDVVEFSRGLVPSAGTIVPGMQSYEYVMALGRLLGIFESGVLGVHSEKLSFSAFIAELLFSRGTSPPLEVTIVPTLPSFFIEALAGRLTAAGIATSS